MTAIKLYTLVYIKKTYDVLLGLKMRGFGAGLWNGFGGKVENGESLRLAAVREIQEECGLSLSPNTLRYRGLLEVEFNHQPQIMAVKVFTTDMINGQPTTTEEMTPRWFRFDNLPLSDMWPDNEEWVPQVLEEKNFRARYLYSPSGQLLKRKHRILKPHEINSEDSMS